MLAHSELFGVVNRVPSLQATLPLSHQIFSVMSDTNCHTLYNELVHLVKTERLWPFYFSCHVAAVCVCPIPCFSLYVQSNVEDSCVLCSKCSCSLHFFQSTRFNELAAKYYLAHTQQENVQKLTESTCNTKDWREKEIWTKCQRKTSVREVGSSIRVHDNR